MRWLPNRRWHNFDVVQRLPDGLRSAEGASLSNITRGIDMKRVRILCRDDSQWRLRCDTMPRSHAWDLECN